jgi:glycosyltransferase involved in cell wall biosynthesis
MRLAITIPAYNEEKTIEKTVREIKKVVGKNKYDAKILVVDDGSVDKTAAVARNAGALVFSHPRNYGLAETFRTEIEKCLELKADVIVHIDADGQYVANEIPLLIREVKKGADLVLGSRFKGKIEEMPFIKRIGNKAFSVVVSNITGMKISDAQTGFRAFKKKLAQGLKII